MRFNAKELLISAVIVFIAFSVKAQEAAGPCDLQWKAYLGAADSEKTEASEVYKKCLALANEQKKIDYASTRESWAASLDKLPAGGWNYLIVDPAGMYAIFGSHRHATRQGNIVAVWIRYEYREQQPENYKSFVQRMMYDCARMTVKVVAATYYSDNNLGGTVGNSYSLDELKMGWSPAIPGSIGDSILDWACRTVPRSQPPKAGN